MLLGGQVFAAGAIPTYGPAIPEGLIWEAMGPSPDVSADFERPDWSIAYDAARVNGSGLGDHSSVNHIGYDVGSSHRVLPAQTTSATAALATRSPPIPGLPPEILAPPPPLPISDLGVQAPAQPVPHQPVATPRDATNSHEVSRLETTDDHRSLFGWFMPWTEGWDGKIQLGFNGSSGNSDASIGRIDLNARRTVNQHEITMNSTYRQATREGVRTENRLRTSGQYDWKPQAETKWRLYATGRFEIDEFQSWDYRVDGFVGGGYDFLKSEKTTFITRLGFGGRQDFGGSDDGFRPEGVLEFEASQKLSARQTLTGRFEVVPDFDSADYRVNSQANWSIVIDPESNLSLRLGADIRFDSGSSSNESTDIDYFMTLGWSF